MKRQNSFIKVSLLTLSVAVLALAFTSQANAKPKYASTTATLSNDRSYFSKGNQSDFWRLIPYYVHQQTDSACSIATATIVFNGMKSKLGLTSDDELLSQDLVLKLSGNKTWARSVGKLGHGVELAKLGEYMEQAGLKVTGSKVSVQTIYGSDLNLVQLEKLLIENEKNEDDFILANFLQSAFTDDADVGHISPVGAYDKSKKRVLVLDTDRKWYEPYWVSLETFLKGIQTKDKASGKSRGLVIIQPAKN
jgi:hypothetical protein